MLAIILLLSQDCYVDQNEVKSLNSLALSLLRNSDVTGKLPVELRLPVTMSNNKGRVDSYKASQPRKQGAYKHSHPVLYKVQGTGL